MRSRSPVSRLMVFLVALMLPLAALEADEVGKMRGNPSAIEWDLTRSGHESITLDVQAPDGTRYQKTFRGQQPLSFRASDMRGALLDGVYSYELRVTPQIPGAVKAALAAARASGDDARVAEIMKANGLGQPVVQSGSFGVLHGAFLDPSAVEPDANDAKGDGSSPNVSTSATPSRRLPGEVSVDDQVIPDDLIVQSSACVGFDCVDGESFGFDTIRMKENNVQINFMDTSTSAGFPTNDWTIVANDSNSGGQSYLAFNDVTAARKTFLVEAAAPANALYVDSTGKIGMRQANPALDIHMSTSDTPAVRFEQTNAGGFTAQTWDIGANEANFFVRDVTGGSRLSFRIRPGAPTSSLDIAADGKVGIGTASPGQKLHVSGTFPVYQRFSTTDGTANNKNMDLRFSTITWGDFSLASINDDGSLKGTRLYVDPTGNVGIGGTTSLGAQFVIANGATTSSINAGSSQFTVSSSRTFKNNIMAFAVPNILAKIAAVPVVTYDFKDAGPKNVLGLVAEDFHTVLNRGDEKYIDGHHVQMALWMAVQELTKQNKSLNERIESLEKQLSSDK